MQALLDKDYAFLPQDIKDSLRAFLSECPLAWSDVLSGKIKSTTYCRNVHALIVGYLERIFTSTTSTPSAHVLTSSIPTSTDLASVRECLGVAARSDKHLIQEISLSRLLIAQGVVEGDLVIEVASGTGELSAVLAHYVPVHSILLDNHPSYFYRDRYERPHNCKHAFVQCDIRDAHDMILNTVRAWNLSPSTNVWFVGKHVCGSATDYVMQLIQKLRIRICGMVMALCCHCKIDPRHFEQMYASSSSSSSSSSLASSVANLFGSQKYCSIKHQGHLTGARRVNYVLRAKQLCGMGLQQQVNQARLNHARTLFQSSQLVSFVPDRVTVENTALVCKNGESFPISP